MVDRTQRCSQGVHFFPLLGFSRGRVSSSRLAAVAALQQVILQVVLDLGEIPLSHPETLQGAFLLFGLKL